MRYQGRAITFALVLLGIALTFVTGRALWLEIGAVSSLSLIAIEAGTETFDSVRHKL